MGHAVAQERVTTHFSYEIRFILQYSSQLVIFSSIVYFSTAPQMFAKRQWVVRKHMWILHQP